MEVVADGKRYELETTHCMKEITQVLTVFLGGEDCAVKMKAVHLVYTELNKYLRKTLWVFSKYLFSMIIFSNLIWLQISRYLDPE